MPYKIELGPDGSPNATLEASDLFAVDVAKPHTAIADFDAEAPFTRSLIDHAMERVRVYASGNLLFRGYLKELDYDQNRGITRINGPGIGNDLKDSAIERSWVNTATHKAIRQVWDQDTDFQATVRDPEVSEIVSDKVITDADTQAELQSIRDSIPATAPLVVTSDGTVRMGQSAYVQEAENPPQGFDAGTYNAPGHSDGAASVVFSEYHDPGWNFTTEYDIPGDQWGVSLFMGTYLGKWWDTFRWDTRGNGFDVYVDGSRIGGAGGSNGFGFGYQPQETIPQYADDVVLNDGGNQTNYTSEFNDDTADDVPLLPSPPATGDAIYFGWEQPFDTLELDISTPASWSGSVTWEYYAKEMNDGGSDWDTSDDSVNTEGWRSIPNVTDNTNGFRQSGNVEWDLSDILEDTRSGGDYTKMSDDGGPDINDVYVRARVTSFSSMSTQPMARQGWPWGGVMSWLDFRGGSSTLEAGDHTVQIKNVEDSGYHVVFDTVALFDQRFSYNWDEQVHEYGGYLDGPELFPAQRQFQFDQYETEFNVIGATAELTGVPDTSGPFAVSVSPDGGASWYTTNNGTTVDEDFPSNTGKTVDYRVTLGRYGTRDTATPRKGYQSQEFDAIQVEYDGSDLSIIQDDTFRGSPYQILTDLHDRAGYRWAIDHAATDGSGDLVKSAESFETGTITKSPDWTVKNRQPKLSFVNYANEVTIYGELLADGTRPKVTVQDQGEVNQFGREPYFEVRPDLGTLDAVRSVAIDVLTQKVRERDQKGTLEVLPTDIQPGYSYPVDWFVEGEATETPLESVQFSESPESLRGSLKFALDEGVTETVIDQGTAIRTTKRSI